MFDALICSELLWFRAASFFDNTIDLDALVGCDYYDWDLFSITNLKNRPE